MKFGERYTPSEMDEYDKKFAEMQKYIPFLEAMIERLQNVKDKSREIQLQKMQSLHGILSNSKRKLKIETLQRCEDVLQKLHNKVEKGNTPGLHFPNKKGESNSMQSSAVSENTNVDQSKIVTIPQKTEETTETIDIHETPASPSPPVSPDSGSQVAPIIIPTERSVDFIDDKSDSKPASPDPVETLPTKAPIIIPTERTSSTIILSPSSNFSSNKNTDDTSFSEWEMLEESEAQNARNKSWQNVVPSHHDVNNSTKLGGANWTQKINDKRSHVSSRHIPTVPVPSLGVSRRLPLVAEKNRLSGRNVDVVTSDSRPESPINAQDVKLKSPEPDMLFPKHKSSSPRLKEGHGVPKTSSKPSAPLLLSPPPVSTEPPLSMEDLAELLNEEGDSKTEKKNDRSGDEAGKLKKDTCKQELTSTSNKDTKGPKPFLLTQDDIDKESERRWEEVDKHIVKLTSRKCLPINVSASPSAKVETSKSSETKGPQSSSSVHNHPSFSINVEKVTDNRNVSSSPSSKAELRYADNYERHPRHSRDNHGHDNVKDKINPNSHCRQSDDDMGNAIPVLHSGLAKPDDRSNALYQRRQPNVVPEAVPPRIDTEFRVEGPDYFNRQVPNPNHWPPMHPPVNTNEFGNNQWIPPNNFVGMPNTPPQPPHPYPHPMGMHQEMWNMGAAGNTVHMDPHPINDTQLRPNQMPPNINTGIRPLMSPTARPPDICHNSRPDNIREDLPNVNVSPIQPLISPTGFPVGPQYRNFQPENRPYEPVFDRGMEYPHVRPSWEQQPGRTNDIPYRGENEVPCGIIGPESLVGTGNSYPRPSTPCPWNRDRDRSNRGRGRDTYYNDRNRGEIRNNFNRDSRRPEWTRDNHTEWDNCNRFNRDSRNISDRDPRVRIEHGAPNQNQNQSRDNNSTSARDPRLAKDKHLPAPKGKDTSYNERDPRKRQVPPPLLLSPRKTKEKPKSPPKSFDNHKRSDGEGNRHPQDKTAKDKMQSPLESLYGVIDTKAKSAQGYCLQNFKIPKIKRTEPSVSPTPSPTSEELKVGENKSSPEKQEEKVLKVDDERQHQGQSIDKDDATAEVSSSSDGQIVPENWNREDTSPDKKVDVKEDIANVETTEEADKNTLKIGEADSHGIVSPKPSEDIEKPETPEKPLTEVAKAEALKSKEEVTQEWIEALIRKSFEFGEGKKFVEQAKLMQKLGAVLQTKKLKKIKKIIESESESSSSDKDNCLEPRKTQVRRKRRVIVSDSSDEECLAERLGILNTITNKEEPKKTPCDEVASDAHSDTEKKEPLSSNIEDSKEDTKEYITTKAEDTVQEIIQDSSEDISHHLSENIAEKEELKKEETSTKDTENMEKEDTSDMNDTTPKDETVGDKDSTSKTPKAKAKRRNSLEMLQEDIREMFISEGVVTATGYRMCRMQKESQNNVSASTSNQNALITKKDEPSSKCDGEATFDIEELPLVSSKQKRVSKSRNTDESGKSKIRHKKEGQRVTRQRSKRYVQSSDSEEDQPLALRTELIQNSSIVSNEEETETHNEESETTPRRSKRVMYKEIIKESRVIIEKTDMSKLECSKIMFDSSSDESFGIDVSELAAAVDISLHPEKQSEPSEVDTAEKRKSDGNTAKRTSKKKSKEPVAEDKPDDVIVLTDEESIISDISLSSSVTSGKKMNVGATKMETSNEELLSNILVGLVPTKTDLEKDTRTADKGSDADVDDDTSDQLPADQNVKKTSVKRKKKKCNWQLGILSKKKRKRALTSCALKFEVDLNTSSEAEASLKLNNSSILGDSTNDGMDETSLDNTKETIGDKLDTTIKDIGHNEISKAVLNDQKLKVSPEVLNPSEESLCKSTSPRGELPDAKNVQSNPCETDGITTKNITDNKKTEYDDAVENAFRNLEVKKLIDYAWTGKDRYKCLLCFFTGKNIVHHYKLNHPGKEILISRLKVADALLAIQDAKDNKLADVSVKSLTEDRKFNCRFCPFFTEGATKVAMEAFYEHCTTHTGEYRFQCNSCPYQAVAKSSMRTHYYKNCRLYNDTFSESITEDEIPQENCIYGYLCSTCNYVQLKEKNLHKHLELWHANDLNTSIIKINMSFDAIKEKNEESATDQLGTDLVIDVEKPETSIINKVMDSCEQNDDDDDDDDDNDGNGDDNDDRLNINTNDNENENQDPLKDEQETAINSEKTSDHNNTELEREESVPVKVSDEKQTSLQTDTEIPLPTEKLSAFVCPPELEKKEVEIELERKRKMQEIIENIGIKLQKDAFKKRLSIIDKLQDKMKTDLPVGHNQNNESNLVADSSIKNSTSLVESSGTMVFQNNTTESLSLSGAVHSVEKTEINSLAKQETLIGDKQVNNSILISAQSLNIEPISPFTPQVQKLDAKLKDPLTTIDQRKNDESEIETSDNENVRNIAPIYESDSSSEQSDSELPTDVNMLLKETSNIAASSKDPMLTTIQRLAAQLQAAKPLEIGESQNSSKPKKAVRKASLFSHIPKPPNVIPIASIKKFVGKLDANYREVSSEHDDSNPPKNFIRLRRLSGDMLSMPVQNLDFQEDPLALNDESSCKASKRMETILQTDEEECSFLKIESVVSLAPRANNNDTESPIINDIRKAVETSPVKNKGVSILKKSNSPLILKRLNAVTITQPLTKNVQTMQPSTSEKVKLIPVKSITSPSSSVATTQLGTNFVPIAPKSKIIQLDNKLSFPLAVNKTSVIAPVTTRTVTVTGSSTPQNLNYKIVKVLCAPTVLKPKDPQPSTMKLKSADAYNAMLKTVKLTHLYKCMARDCRYTTDVLGNYHQHYLQHMIETEKKKGTAPFDFQKCAYCYLVLNDWNKMKVHMEEKHAHCRYQCSYCFYRAIVPSYVQIHQTISHPGYHGILLGKLVKELPLKEEINRHDYIRPFVCQHECGKFFYVPEAFAAHLKTKHHSLLLLFKCHLCAATCLKVDQLITHYKVHGFFKYQCLYCLNGSENFNDMFVHLSAFHCNRIPQVLERSLPPQPVRNKDVIEQLIVRTLDENIKSLELIEVDGDVKGNKETLLPKKIAMIDKDENVVLNKLLSNLLGSVKTSNNNPDTDTFSIALADHGKIPSSENCNDMSTIKISEITYDDSNMSASSTSSKQTTDNISLSLPSTNTIFAFSDESLKDSLKLSEGFDCSDEFININLLDNPDFLKNADSQRNVKNTLSTCESKADDSDIEILDIQDSGSSSKKETKYLSDAAKYPDSDTKEKRTSMSKQKSGAEDQSGSCNGSKNPSTSNETNKKSADINVKPERLLTLEDIKDTGFTGTKLYKCGYEECSFGAPTPALLRAHVKECPHGGDNKNLNCAHCNKRFIKIGFLLEHLKLHGLKRFGCSLCKMRCTVGYQAMAHMKAKHKLANSKLIPADPKNPSADGLFIVQPVNPSAERKGKKRKNAKSTEKEGDKDKLIDVEKLCFSPDEIDSLPRQAIYNREVQCAMCPYTTKVRTNIIRHLQLHAKDESVPESGPVNPVPCLDKKERMFDKMVNLASSSHQNGRMGAKAKEAPKENDDEFIPKFVPENKRYVCSVAECNYLTVDEAMLRYHLKALHSDEPYFRCPHCPQPQPGQENLNIAIDKMGVHLKMHDTRLYKCSHCNHHHYHRHVVERHLSDKHPEKRPFVKVVRELESTENNQQTVQEEVEEEVPDPDGNHWKCNICEYKCVYKAEMVTHTTTAHDEKCQFKCTLCSFKTSGKIMFEQHINSKHSTEANVDYILIYQRIKGVNKKSTDNVEQSGQEEPFDTTPLWRRDMPRIRHIRGILLEEEDTLTESSVKPGKRKSENSDVLAVKPAKIKPGKSGSLDDPKQSKEKSKRSLSEKMPVDVENLIAASSIQKRCDTDVNADKSSKEPKAVDADGNDLNDSDIGRFGPYGKPDGNMYVCTLCTLFKTKYKHDMRDHLYRELNYARWHCKECGYLSVNRNALLKHFNKHHQGGRPDHEPLSPDDDIEDWVCTLLKRQTCIMKGLSTLKRNNSGADISTSSSADVSTPTVVDDKASVTKVPQNTPNKTFKTIDLTQKHPDVQDSTVQGTEIDINAHDDDSRDEAPLVIDLKEEAQLKSEKNESLSEMEEGPAIAEGEQPKAFTCKHCKLIFTRWRGFKLHLHLTHLKRLGYICPYCDRSTNSEALMRQHIRLKHPRCPEKIIQNPAAGGPELTDDFWQKEYGIVFPKKLSKKRKRASLEGGGVDNDNCDQSETQEKCTLCGFIAVNYAGLKDHMRIHEQKSLQCKHCTFTATTQAEMWDHWEVNHPLLSFRFDDLSPPGSSSVEPKATQDEEKYNIDDYSDDIEEEYISDVRDELMYCCFYCPLRSKSLETVRHHWTVIHKDSKLSKDSAKLKGNLPFRYKELRVPVPSPPKSYKKAHSSENDSDSPYELYMQHSQNEVEIIEQSETKQEGWICQWCDEFCDSETKMKTHQNMFHSHLPLNFKRQGSNEAPKGYVCPECSFTTTFINTMKSHVSKHINIFKCKYCDRTFNNYTLVSAHTTDEHPGMEVKIESIQNYDALVDKIMAKVKWYKSDERPADQKETVLNVTSPKRHAVARKSTTKSTALAQSIPSKVKAVARKSTNPHSRYLSSGKFNEGDKPDEKLTKSKQYSYYGVPRSPINLTKLNTYMVVGGHRMKVNCTTLSQLININPKVVLKDLKNDIKNISVLSKLK